MKTGQTKAGFTRAGGIIPTLAQRVKSLRAEGFKVKFTPYGIIVSR